MDISGWDLVIIGIISIFMSTLGSVSGGGAGFVMTPLLIFMGLSPAQAVSTGKIAGLSVAVGSLTGLRGTKLSSRRRVIWIAGLALVVGLIAPFIIKSLDATLYRRILGVLMLALVPLIHYKKIGQHKFVPTRLQLTTGWVCLLIAQLLLAVFSGGMGTLINIALMGFMGMSAIEANVTKRISTLTLNAVIVLGVFSSGLIYWPIALISIFTNLIGGYLGGRIALKKGDVFVMRVFLVLMVLSAVWLLFG